MKAAGQDPIEGRIRLISSHSDASLAEEVQSLLRLIMVWWQVRTFHSEELRSSMRYTRSPSVLSAWPACQQYFGSASSAAKSRTRRDGGMNKVFLARFPGRVTLSKVMPYASYMPEQLPAIPWVDKDGSLTSKFFGTLF